MRIAFLDSWLQTNAEGSGTAAGIGGLGRALVARGHTVDRLAPPVPWPHNLTLRRLWFNTQLPALLRGARYDLVVGFDIDGAFWRRRPPGVPYICSIKGVIAEELRYERGGVRRLLWTLSRLERRNARHADVVITTSAYCRAAIERHYGVPAGKVRLVPEGIDLARWERIAAETPRVSDGATVLCVARQYPRKHVDDLLRALPAVRRAVPGACALIVGDGPARAGLERELAGAPATFTGFLQGDDLATAYASADLFVFPSATETFGQVIQEAMASGLPVVAARAGGALDLIREGETGLFFAPGSPADLRAAARELLDAPERRAAMGRAARAAAERRTWSHVLDALLEHYTRVIRPHVRARARARLVGAVGR